MKAYMKPPMNRAEGGIMSIVEDEENSYEDRTPENMEILSNNLRGDIRSMDDRYAELAQMVGEEQAAQTPPEVVALFQTKMTQPQPMPPVPAAKANGIAGLMGGQQAPQQGAPGQPPMPPEGQMPPGAPPTPTGQPPVQRQLGSGPSGEMGDPGENYGNFRINVTGVGDDQRDLQRETIPPLGQIPQVTAQTPAPKLQPLLPPLQNADAFVEGYQSQGGSLPSLLEFVAQPAPQFQKNVDVLGEYLKSLSNDPELTPAPARTQSFGGIESLVAEPASPLAPQVQETIEDVAQGFLQSETIPPVGNIPAVQAGPLAYEKLTPSPMPDSSQQAAAGASNNQKKENASSGLAGAGLGKLLGALGGLLGGKKEDKRNAIDDYLRMMAFAAPRSANGQPVEDNYLDMFGKMPGEPDQIAKFDRIADVTGARSIPTQASAPQVFPVAPPNIQERPLAPQRMAAKGSGPEGERKEPILRIKDQLNANDPFNLGAKPGTIRAPELMPQAPGVSADVDVGKSRPLTPEELDDYMRSKGSPQSIAQMTAKERAALSPATKTLYQMSQQMGIDPIELTNRLNTLSGKLKKLPGVGKLFKGMDAFNKLSTGKKAAVIGGTGFTAGALLRPNDGVVPPVPPSKFGVEQIPTEYDTPTPTTPPGDGAPPDIGKPLEIDMFPGLNRERDVRLGMDLPDAADNEYNRTKGMDLGEVLGPRLPETDEEPEISAAKTIGSELGIKGKPGDDDYEAQIRKRADLYQRLLGDDPNDRQMKAYLLLAEAGLKMMSTKGRSFGEIMGKSLQGLPSGLGQIAADSSKIRRAAISAAISDVNAQRLAKTKADATVNAALARTTASNLPRLRKIEGTAAMLAAKKGRPADDPVILRVAEGLVDGYIQTDTHGNFRGPDGAIAVYGESTRFKENDRGYIPADSPFLIKDPPRPVQVTDEAGITKVKEQIYKDQVLATEIEKILAKVGDISGLSNVIQRSIAKGTVPIFGDLGPLTERSIALENYAKAINPLIKDAMRINQGRLLKMEAEQLKDLEFDPERFFTTPGVELAKLSRTLAYVKNSIASQYASINPQNEYRQMDVPPMGTKDDPLPSESFSYAEEYFKMQPNGKLHVRVGDQIKTITKEQFEAGMRKQ